MNRTYIILVNDGIRRLCNVEGVQGDAALPAEGVESVRPGWQRSWESNLIISVNIFLSYAYICRLGLDFVLTPRAVYQPAMPRNSERFLRSVGLV